MMNFVPRTIPPYRARTPSAPASPTPPTPEAVPSPEYEYELELDDEDLDALEFEAAVMARASAPSPIAVPTSKSTSTQWRPALPVQALGALDAHCWDQQPSLLAHWARGAGVGAAANSVTDAMFTPCSPPRTSSSRTS